MLCRQDPARVYDPQIIKAQFPLLANRELRGEPPIVYLDSASTTQKPQCVIRAIEKYLVASNANINRGVYALSESSTEQYEHAREVVARFIGATHSRNIVFTHGTTESINMVALGWARNMLKAGDTIIVTEVEHHANIVPWQMLAKNKGVRLTFLPVDEAGSFDKDIYARLLEQNPKLVCVSGMSNVTGYLPPCKQMVEWAQRAGARTLIDAAQLVAHKPLDVRDLGVDFLAFSGHKLYGPTGIGVLYANDSVLDDLEPVFGGGVMVSQVTTTSSILAGIPTRFEAGTPAIVEAIGLNAALEFLESIGMAAIEQQGLVLYRYALEKLLQFPNLTILGNTDSTDERVGKRTGIISFAINGIHPHDVAQAFDDRNICMRGGHHCAMPLHHALHTPGSSRISFGVYTTQADLDVFADVLAQIIALLT